MGPFVSLEETASGGRWPCEDRKGLAQAKARQTCCGARASRRGSRSAMGGLGFGGFLRRRGRCRCCCLGIGWKLSAASSSAGVSVATDWPSSLLRLRHRNPPARLQGSSRISR